MMQMIWDSIMSTDVTFWNALFRLLLSLLLGALVGVERRRRGQVAGMRTFALIAMGATLAMLVSIYIPQEYLGLKNGDPGRIAAQVISGIGFLGAGAIIQMKGSVRGLTTAAGIWITACLGLAIGAGMYGIAIIATGLILAVFYLLDMIEHHVFHGAEQKIIRIKVRGIVDDVTPYRQCLSDFKVEIAEQFLRYDYADDHTVINFMIRANNNTDFVRLFATIRQLANVRSLTLTNELNN